MGAGCASRAVRAASILARHPLPGVDPRLVSIDPRNPVVELCAAGIAVEGVPQQARALFARAWDARRDDYDACIAAHYLARHQATPEQTLEWNERALMHALRVPAGRTDEFLPSLYLNLGDALAAVGRDEEARAAAEQAATCLSRLPGGGYRDLVAGGIRRLQRRLAPASAPTADDTTARPATPAPPPPPSPGRG